MYDGVLEFVLLFIVEDHAVVVHEVQDAGLPEGSAQELHEEVVLPFLRRAGDTSSAYCCALGLGGAGGYYFLRPKSHSNIDLHLYLLSDSAL